MCLMKFQIYILLKRHPLEATVFKATEYRRLKNLPTQGSWATSEGDSVPGNNGVTKYI